MSGAIAYMNQNLLLKTSLLHLVISITSVAGCASLVLSADLSPALLFIVLAAVVMVATGIFYVLQHMLSQSSDKHSLSEKQQLQLALDAAGECLWDWQLADGSTSIHFSRPYSAMLGYEPNEFARDQQGWRELLHPDEREHVQRRITRMLSENSDQTYENTYRMRHKDGSYRWIHSRGRLFSENNEPVRFIGIAADISQSRENSERLRLANAVFDSTHEGVLITDANNITVFVNPAFSKITGFSYAEIVGDSPRLLQSGRHSKEFYAEMWRSLDSKDHWTGEIWNRRKNGEVLPQLQTITQLRDEHGLITHRVAVFSDIAQLKDSQSELSFLAHYDPLTCLPNRTLLHEHLKLSLHRATKQKTRAALLIIGIDHFKSINESVGHAKGDDLLKQITARIQQIIDPQDTLSRFGGDEFAMVCDSCNDGFQAANTAEKVLALFRQPFHIDSQDLSLTVSIGICMYPEPASAEEILRDAETALVKTKENERGSYSFYNTELTESATRKLRIASELRAALDDNQLTLHFQPVFSLGDRQIAGCEALVHWQHPELGLIMSAELMEVARLAGHTRAMDSWMMRHSCHQAQQWLQQDLSPGFVSVNITSRLLERNEHLVFDLQKNLSESGLPAHMLELEITESSMMDNPEAGMELLQKLRNLGVRLTLDDFGSGYSSLARLKRLPIDKLKIAQPFMQNLVQDPTDLALVETSISLANSLKLLIQAEGVDTQEQADLLAHHPQMLAQGLLYGNPMPAADFSCLLSEQPASS